MKIPIYPDFLVEEGEYKIEIRTILRKKGDAAWHQWHVSESYHYSPGDSKKVARDLAFHKFHSHVYFALICGLVSEKIITPRGELVFPPDEDQQEESARIRNMLK